MSGVTLQAPVKVSPLIRFGRWTFLTTGILYGLYNYSRLSKKETKVRELEAKQKIITDAKQAVEKKRLYKEEMEYLSSVTGMEVPADLKN